MSETKPWLGLLGAAVAVTIWAGWIVATRMAMVERLDPMLMAFCRAAVPALVLLPVVLRRGLVPRGASLPALLVMTVGWGAPFAYLTATGLQTVPASLFAPLTPGLSPILVALISAWVFGERLTGAVVAGLVLVAAALSLIIGEWIAQAETAALSGVPWLLAASLGFSIYSVMFRRSGLTPLEASAYLGLYSMPLLLPWAALRSEALTGPGWGELAFQLFVQGGLAGIVAAVAYAMALRHLGSVRGSMANALMPVAAGVAGVWLLGERLSPIEWLAIVLASLGVATANGAFRWLMPSARRKSGPS